MIAPSEVFPAWRRAQLAVRRHALEAPPSPHLLRTTGLLWPEVAERVAEWFTTPATPTVAVRRAYRALAHDTARLYEIARRDLGIRVCELVGAVTAYIVSGAKPGLHAKVPTAELLRVVSSHGPLTDCRPPEPVRPAAVAA